MKTIEIVFLAVMLLCVIMFRKMSVGDLVGAILGTIFGCLIIVSALYWIKLIFDGYFFREGIVNAETIQEAMPVLIGLAVSLTFIVINRHIIDWIENGISIITEKANTKILQRLLVLVLSCVQGIICILVIMAFLVWGIHMTSLEFVPRLVQESEIAQWISVPMEMFLRKYLVIY